MRIVSTCPSNTEILFALGLGDSIVGVDSSSDWPKGVEKIPKLGPDLQIDIEKVKSLKPDLVVSSLSVPGMQSVVSGLKKAKLKQITLEPKSISDIFSDITKVAKACGREDRSKELLRTLERRAKAAERRGGKKVYWEWWPRPFITCGKKAWMNEVIEKAGGKNIFSDKPDESPKVEEKEIIERNPDVIVVCWCGSLQKLQDTKKIYARKWGVEAMDNKKVFCVPEELFGRPSQRLIEGLEMLSGLLGEKA